MGKAQRAQAEVDGVDRCIMVWIECYSACLALFGLSGRGHAAQLVELVFKHPHYFLRLEPGVRFDGEIEYPSLIVARGV